MKEYPFHHPHCFSEKLKVFGCLRIRRGLQDTAEDRQDGGHGVEYEGPEPVNIIRIQGLQNTYTR